MAHELTDNLVMIRLILWLSVILILSACSANRLGISGEKVNEAVHSAHSLSLPQRVAFMSGHVEAGLSLYRAGYPAMAAPHLLHPVSETHAEERLGLDSLGFNATVFEAVSLALANDHPAAEIAPLLNQAEDNLELIAERAGGDAVEIMHFLLDVIVREYSIAVTDGVVTDPGEYQDAFGFTVVAIARTEQLPPSVQVPVKLLLKELLSIWPNAPIPTRQPALVSDVLADVQQIRELLPH